jgi:hypothetical protein
VGENHYQTVMDDKSGYDHILIFEGSQTHFSLQWEGWIYVTDQSHLGGMPACTYITLLAYLLPATHDRWMCLLPSTLTTATQASSIPGSYNPTLRPLLVILWWNQQRI